MSLPETKLNEVILAEKVVFIETISNVDDLFQDLLSKSPDHEDVLDERIPYWADLWPSAIGLADFIIKSNVIKPGMKALELGCGAGLPGIIAGQQGASVVFSDYIQDALDLAKRNWEHNNSGAAEFLLMDWRNPVAGLSADIILASDIAYEKKSFADLVHAFKSLLKPAGKMLIAEPNRAFAQAFFSDLMHCGFDVNSTMQELHFRSQKYSIHIHEVILQV